jgi:hypothetical protein
MNQKILNICIALLLHYYIITLLHYYIITITTIITLPYGNESNRGVSGETEGQSRVIQAGRPVFAGEGVGAH